MANPWTPRIKDKIIGLGKPKGVSKSSWECKVRKWVKDAQEEINGTKEPTSNVIQNPNDYIESLREE